MQELHCGNFNGVSKQQHNRTRGGGWVWVVVAELKVCEKGGDRGYGGFADEEMLDCRRGVA